MFKIRFTTNTSFLSGTITRTITEFVFSFSPGSCFKFTKTRLAFIHNSAVNTVERCMFSLAKNLKIFNSIVQSVSINVVNYLFHTLEKWATQMKLHNVAMFWNLTSINIDDSISMKHAALPIIRVKADTWVSMSVPTSIVCLTPTSATTGFIMRRILAFFKTAFHKYIFVPEKLELSTGLVG